MCRNMFYELGCVRSPYKSQPREPRASPPQRSLTPAERIALNHQQRQEQSARRTVEQPLVLSLETIQKFARDAAHDMRGPVRRIAMVLDIITQRHAAATDPDTAELVDLAVRNAHRLDRLLDDVLVYVEAATTPIRPRPVLLGDAVDLAKANLRTEIAESGVILHTDNAASQIPADPDLLQRMLGALLHNAIVYRALDRPLEVRVVSGVASEPGVVLRVEDNGAGFDPERADRLFIPLRRLHAKDDIEGSGMGLALCQLIAHRHGWTLTGESRPGEGAVFTVWREGAAPKTLADQPQTQV